MSNEHSPSQAPGLHVSDQQIIDGLIDDDFTRLRRLSGDRDDMAAILARAKALGLTRQFVQTCRLAGTKAAIRQCMGCSHDFLSWGPQNRLCTRCGKR